MQKNIKDIIHCDYQTDLQAKNIKILISSYVGAILYGGDFDKCGDDIDGGDFAVGDLTCIRIINYKFVLIVSLYHDSHE